MQRVDWRQGWWLNRPPSAGIERGRLKVRAAAGSDAWRTTSYGFVRDSAHALLTDLPDEMAVEVSFLADFDQQFDQAGVLVRIDETRWTKAGVEFCDGALQASTVVTDNVSDWSVAPIPDVGRPGGDDPGQPVRHRADRAGRGPPTIRGDCCGWRRSTRPPSPTPGRTAVLRNVTGSPSPSPGGRWDNRIRPCTPNDREPAAAGRARSPTAARRERMTR